MTTASTPPSKPEPRQQRALETRQRLITVGRKAFAEFGLEGTNLTRDILEPAGVGVGSFYHQFEDKTDLLIEILRQAAAQRREAVMERGFRGAEGLTFEQSVRGAFEQLFSSVDIEEHGWRTQLNVQWIMEPRIRALISELQDLFIGELDRFFATISSADAETRRRAAILLWGVGLGLTTMYLNMSHGEHALDREALIDGAVALTSPGLVALLGV